MTTISVQDLQNIAVQCTSDFFNHNTPLNESLAKQASDLGLNSDQLQRAVEATNTLTYLKGLESSKDRTSEFPVADYKEIVKLASVPESIIKATREGETKGVEKKAALFSPKPSKLEIEQELIKKAESKLEFEFPQLTDQEKIVYLQKYAQINKRALETAKENLEYNALQLVKLAKDIKAHPQGLEHLSASNIEDSQFTKVAELIFGKKEKRLDFVTGMFKAAQIQTTQQFVDLYKEAEALYGEVEYRSEVRDKLIELEKQAFSRP